MGCDIHLSVEKKVNGKWELVKAIDQSEIDNYTEMYADIRRNGKGSIYGHLSEEYVVKRLKQLKTKKTKDWLYGGRNYNLFGILADVRNGRGFAGMKTGEGFNPISEPRGVPLDASEEYLKDVEYWSGDGHSHSFHTLKQLLDYDWDQETVHYGVVSLDVYKACKENNTKPKSWCLGLSDNDLITLSEESADALLAGDIVTEEGKKYFVKMKWGTSYKEVSEFYDVCIPQLQAISEDGVGEDVRIVFFFDN